MNINILLLKLQMRLLVRVSWLYFIDLSTHYFGLHQFLEGPTTKHNRSVRCTDSYLGLKEPEVSMHFSDFWYDFYIAWFPNFECSIKIKGGGIHPLKLPQAG